MARDVQHVLALGALLGEGPVWVAGDEALWFVDIKKHFVYRFRPSTGDLDRWQAPDQSAFVLPAGDGGMVVGLPDGLYRFDPATEAFTRFAAVEPDNPTNRLNDATVAPDGTIWFGTMDNNEKGKTGHTYAWRGGELVRAPLPAVAITNGPAVSPDGRTLYTTDTVDKHIWASPINDDGSLGECRLFATIEDGHGHPDGPTVDAEGCLWTGLYGGWGVRRYDPQGQLMEQVRLPVRDVTKIAFGGPGMITAYATTASKDVAPEDRASMPRAGDLFAFDAGVAGLPSNPAKV